MIWGSSGNWPVGICYWCPALKTYLEPMTATIVLMLLLQEGANMADAKSALWFAEFYGPWCNFLWSHCSSLHLQSPSLFCCLQENCLSFQQNLTKTASIYTGITTCVSTYRCHPKRIIMSDNGNGRKLLVDSNSRQLPLKKRRNLQVNTVATHYMYTVTYQVAQTSYWICHLVFYFYSASYKSTR